MKGGDKEKKELEDIINTRIRPGLSFFGNNIDVNESRESATFLDMTVYEPKKEEEKAMLLATPRLSVTEAFDAIESNVKVSGNQCELLSFAAGAFKASATEDPSNCLERCANEHGLLVVGRVNKLYEDARELSNVVKMQPNVPGAARCAAYMLSLIHI